MAKKKVVTVTELIGRQGILRTPKGGFHKDRTKYDRKSEKRALRKEGSFF